MASVMTLARFLGIMEKRCLISNCSSPMITKIARQCASTKTKKDIQINDDESQKVPQTVPQYKWGQPVPEKMMKKMRSEYHGIKQSDIGDETEWIPIYQIPRFRLIRRIIKMKIALTIYSATLSVYEFMNFLRYQDQELFLATSCAAVTFIGLLLIGNFSRQLIVQIYVTEDNQFIRISRLTFFAKRLDMVLPVALVMALSENNTSKWKSFLKLKTIPPPGMISGYDQTEFYDESFNISLRWGGVLDKERFEAALGNILTNKFGF